MQMASRSTVGRSAKVVYATLVAIITYAGAACADVYDACKGYTDAKKSAHCVLWLSFRQREYEQNPKALFDSYHLLYHPNVQLKGSGPQTLLKKLDALAQEAPFEFGRAYKWTRIISGRDPSQSEAAFYDSFVTDDEFVTMTLKKEYELRELQANSTAALSQSSAIYRIDHEVGLPPSMPFSSTTKKMLLKSSDPIGALVKKSLSSLSDKQLEEFLDDPAAFFARNRSVDIQKLSEQIAALGTEIRNLRQKQNQTQRQQEYLPSRVDEALLEATTASLKLIGADAQTVDNVNALFKNTTLAAEALHRLDVIQEKIAGGLDSEAFAEASATAYLNIYTAAVSLAAVFLSSGSEGSGFEEILKEQLDSIRDQLKDISKIVYTNQVLQVETLRALDDLARNIKANFSDVNKELERLAEIDFRHSAEIEESLEKAAKLDAIEKYDFVKNMLQSGRHPERKDTEEALSALYSVAYYKSRAEPFSFELAVDYNSYVASLKRTKSTYLSTLRALYDSVNAIAEQEDMGRPNPAVDTTELRQSNMSIMEIAKSTLFNLDTWQRFVERYVEVWLVLSEKDRRAHLADLRRLCDMGLEAVAAHDAVVSSLPVLLQLLKERALGMIEYVRRFKKNLEYGRPAELNPDGSTKVGGVGLMSQGWSDADLQYLLGDEPISQDKLLDLALRWPIILDGNDDWGLFPESDSGDGRFILHARRIVNDNQRHAGFSKSGAVCLLRIFGYSALASDLDQVAASQTSTLNQESGMLHARRAGLLCRGLEDVTIIKFDDPVLGKIADNRRLQELLQPTEKFIYQGADGAIGDLFETVVFGNVAMPDILKAYNETGDATLEKELRELAGNVSKKIDDSLQIGIRNDVIFDNLIRDYTVLYWSATLSAHFIGLDNDAGFMSELQLLSKPEDLNRRPELLVQAIAASKRVNELFLGQIDNELSAVSGLKYVYPSLSEGLALLTAISAEFGGTENVCQLH